MTPTQQNALMSDSLEGTVPPAARTKCTGRVEVTKVRLDKPMTEVKTTVTRDDGTVVLDGEAMCYTMPLPKRSV
jgi:hypothetical protein